MLRITQALRCSCWRSCSRSPLSLRHRRWAAAAGTGDVDLDAEGTLVSVALLSRAGKSWRLARAVSPTILVEVSEANVGSSVVIVYRAVGRGNVSVRYGLTRGETRKAYASATINVHVT